jgi:diguanylate cyclase (GGDEF)-like protein
MQDTWTPLLKIQESAYYFGVSKDRPDLLEQLDQAMADIRSVNPFFNEDLKARYNNLISVNSGSLTAAETSWIASSRPIRVGYLEDYYPYSGTDSETGSVDGLLADFLAYLTEKYGLQFKTSGYANDVELNQAFQDGAVDVIFPIYGDSNLGEQDGVMVTDAMIQSTMVLLSRGNDTETFQTLAVTQNDPFQIEYAQRYFPDATLLLCDELKDCVKAVRTGQADFTLIEAGRFNEQESSLRYESLQKLDLQQFLNISLAVRKGETTLYSIFNKGIISMDETAVSSALLYHLRQNTHVTVFAFLRQHILAVLVLVVAVCALVCILLVVHFTSDAKRKKELNRMQCEAEEAQWDANHDNLTGLWNRQYFERISCKLSRSTKPLALLIMDVDRFKQINDQYGHEMGDDALKKVAWLLKMYFRSEDHVIRYAGDEFVVIMENITRAEQNVIARKLQQINYRLQNSDDDIPSMTLSVGVVFSDHGYTPGMLNQADKALYQTKENGRSGFTVYSGA